MGIFDFLRGYRDSKSVKKSNASIGSPQTLESNNKKEFVAQKEVNDLDENLEIILNEVEIQKYINQEISNRIALDPKLEFISLNFDPILPEAAAILVVHQQASASLLQRKLKLGYNRAGKLIDHLEVAGIIGPFFGGKPRSVFIPDLIQLDSFLQLGEMKSEKLNHFTTIRTTDYR